MKSFHSVPYYADTYKHVWIETIGKSYEGNDLNVVKICYHNCRINKIILIEAGIVHVYNNSKGSY